MSWGWAGWRPLAALQLQKGSARALETSPSVDAGTYDTISYTTPCSYHLGVQGTIKIDGISYVNSYRTDFGEQIEQQGIDSVIKRLESGEKPEAIAKRSAAKSS